MEFCPVCRSFMLPKRTGDKTVLSCRECGQEIDNFRADEYKITEISRRKRRDILVIEERKKKKSEEERRYITDLYGTGIYEAED